MLRREYPRPDFVRNSWLSLNGPWGFAFDDKNVGIQEKWWGKPEIFTKTIQVPFAFQTELSGINDPSFHDVVWYHKNFVVKKNPQEQIILHFGAIDFISDVYLNGQFIFHHEGGQTGFSVDITPYLIEGEQQLVVRVFDSSTDLYFPRGKQYWKEKSESIWYTRTTGIWQSVWLESLPEKHVSNIRFTPDFDRGIMKADIQVNDIGLPLYLKVSDRAGNIFAHEIDMIVQRNNLVEIKVFHNPKDAEQKAWTPENPYLFNVEVYYGKDVIKTYFGVRKISTQDGKIYLNNKPYYLKLILDQGYWPESLLTPPSIEALKKDILLSKAMGFNGARKHQKVEDPYFAYLADQLGYLIWGEMASSIQFSEQSAKYNLSAWEDAVLRDYNHPSIIAWVPLNESWGVPEIRHNLEQQQHSVNLYDLIKKLDSTRLISNNDGWEITVTDICGIHNYCHGRIDEKEQQLAFKHDISSTKNLLASKPAKRPIYAEGYHHQGSPIVLTEFGGIAFDGEQQGWGYTATNSGAELISEYRRIIEAIKDSDSLAGYCYTQLTDVEQEINGLLTYHRETKVPLEEIKKSNDLI
ncbi:glycoside hydrolase family 2 protein [Trichlorobacter sp.]|jgi:beta-galactosidase/beta-glucuronidase|uniref:glycoside hydrolase family 2 protein n=1 Tax=Trichlorobacter sp. TaxID=2911007 RepID=UPI002A35E6B7|nr:sugar-binding domain-containing protein [Trichlorobacter sp.]MDY0385431.1 glycoside hydrolase family 2 TIM barrel-domain containing protein [Trichlorobacter sp.]